MPAATIEEARACPALQTRELQQNAAVCLLLYYITHSGKSQGLLRLLVPFFGLVLDSNKSTKPKTRQIKSAKEEKKGQGEKRGKPLSLFCPL